MAEESTVHSLNVLEQLWARDNAAPEYDIQIENNDDHLLDEMRTVIKAYVQECAYHQVSESLTRNCRKNFEILRVRLRDPMLKEYSSFEFMEKLYMQEYLADNELMTNA